MEKQEIDWCGVWCKGVQELSSSINTTTITWKPIRKRLLEAYDSMCKAMPPNRKDNATDCLKNLEEASRYLKYRLADFAMHREAYKAAVFQNKQRAKILRKSGRWIRYIACLIHAGISRYNTGFLRFFIFVVVWLLFFALLYFIVNTKSVSGAIISYDGELARGFSYIYFSAVTLTTLGFGDFHPSGWLPQLLTVTESVSGYLALAYLVYLFSHVSDVHPNGPPDWMKYYEDKLLRDGIFGSSYRRD